MNSVTPTLLFTADRDSVCAGDDCESHERSFAVSRSALIQELIKMATSACPPADISGGKATWVVLAGGRRGGKPIAVLAQQWTQPRLLVLDTTTVESIFDSQDAKLFFKYWGQADPDGIFNDLASNNLPPDRYA
jgi:hypothetical protein